MQPHQKTILKILLILFFLTGGFLFVATTFAQVEPGIEIIANEIALPTEDPRVVAARIIRVALGFLGIVAVVIVLYGGFVWMTAAGNEERLAKAKKILTSGLIGLIIIIMAFSITHFVLTKLMEATGMAPGVGEPGPPPPGWQRDALIIRSIQPTGSIPIRNVVVRVVFNRHVNAASLEGNFTVKKLADQSLVDGTTNVEGSIVVFIPNAPCPPPNVDRKCFDSNTEFVVEVTTAVRSADGKSLMCGGLAPACRATFTTGDLVDVTGPTVEITYPDPGQSVPADSLVRVDAHATDDAGIAYLKYFANGSGEPWDPDNIDTPDTLTRDFYSSRDWDTAGLTLLSRHTLTSRAFDIDENNTTSDGVEVIVRAAHCFNGEQDADDTGIDCGGVNCGGCDGESCTTGADCRSGYCIGGVCRNLPVITGVAPNNGAPGNYITIFGQGFGATPGSVFFADNRRAPFPAGCAASATWQPNQIIIEVPTGAVDGPIRVEVPPPAGATASDYIDSTNDARGPLLPNFDVNEIRRPGICALNPTEGPSRTEVTATGTQFGTTQGTSEILFGGTRSISVAEWVDARIRATVPLIAPATVPVQVTVGGQNSNPYSFRVTPALDQPRILRFEPTSGPVGEYVTIFGSNFGSDAGQVFFTNSVTRTQDLLADTIFPPACGTQWWKNDTVVVKVPAGAMTGILKLRTAGGLEATTAALSPQNFTVNTATPKPGICLLRPDNGPERTPVNIFGERLGTTTGTVKFWRDRIADTTVWQEGQITTSVPTGAETGPVNVTVGTPPNTQTSNSLNFTVRDCRDARTPCPAGQECCRDGTCEISPPTGPGCVLPAGQGYYFWQFSTGEIPVYPQVVEECTGPPPQPLPSPTPWSERGQVAVCVNAKISARFTMPISLNTLTLDNVQVYKCTGAEPDPCVTLDSAPVSGSITFKQNLGPPTNQARVDFTPNPLLEQNKWYQITLKDNIISLDGFKLDGNKDGIEGGDYVFKFKTRNNTDLCTVGWVGVQPYERTAEEENELIAYQGDALAAGDHCLMLNSSLYPWNWSVIDPRNRPTVFATVNGERTLDENGNEITSTPDQAVATALFETIGTPPAEHPPVRITGEIPAERKSGYGNLTIDFTDPKVIEKWPDCQDACVNAAIGARFNTRMKNTTVDGVARDAAGNVEKLDNVKLYVWRCGNGVIELGEDCDDGNVTNGDGCDATCLNKGKALCAGFNPAVPGTPGTGQNCCGNGRRETGEDCDGVPFPAGCKSDGAINNCTNLGTAPTPGGTCGNGIIEEGEDCDPPRPAMLGTQGCSSNCLNLGADALAPPTADGISITPEFKMIDIGGGRKRYELEFKYSGNLLPNTWYRAIISGLVESRSGVRLTDLNYDNPFDARITTTTANPYDSYSWAFKTKNDPTVCSVDRVEVLPARARLTWIGAKQNYVSNPYGAPDECNPRGQRLRALSYNWTWSSEKTEVATVSRFDRYPKCGNGVIEFGEDCDDGTMPPIAPVAGDGCSDQCLNEGQGACTYGNQTDCARDKRCQWGGTTPSCSRKSVCGNRAVEIGEDCDDGNTRSGDGCNSVCVHEGSIAGGSVCGNFARETGEDCDDGNTTSNDGCSNFCLNEGTKLDSPDLIDPFQTATSVGLAAADEAAELTESTTEIRAETQTKRGKGDLTVVCGYGPAKPCPATPSGLGVGTNTCCYLKPQVETCDPSDPGLVGCSSRPPPPPPGNAVCRNALLSVTFDQEMDPAHITGNFIIAGRYDSCPAGVTCVTGTFCPTGSVRTGNRVNNADWCVGASVATISTSSHVFLDGTTRKTEVDINLTKLLDADRTYMVIVKGDNTTSPAVEGVRSKMGVALGGTGLIAYREGGSDFQSRSWTFTTGPDICLLESVEIQPSEHLFHTLVPPGHQQNFTARAKDFRGRPISSIAGVYSWNWFWASSIADTDATKNVVSLSSNKWCEFARGTDCARDENCPTRPAGYVGPLCVGKNIQTATAENRNGEEIISASALIITDEITGLPLTPSRFKTDTALAMVYLCEIPWPPKMPATQVNPTGLFPFEDKSGNNDGVPLPFYNFKIHYCRDRGEPGVQDDLPSFVADTPNVVRKDYIPTDTTKDELLREYLFTFPAAILQNWYCSISQTPCVKDDPTTCPAGAGECRATPDAVGIRIYENADHLTPTEWYAAQGLRFGSPQSIEVDGYEAIKDGRTVYVAAANDTEGAATLYTNIYLISYNDKANPDTINIYNQILENLRFNINLLNNTNTCTGLVCSRKLDKVCNPSDTASCATNEGTCDVRLNCSSDLDCPGATKPCQAPKDKLTRDVQRIIDLTKMKNAIDAYRRAKGFNPKLEAGTYIRAMTASVWGSWTGVLGAELAPYLPSLPNDPLNKIVNCPAKVCTDSGTYCTFDGDCQTEDRTGKCVPVDTPTCWSVDAQTYQCPSGSHIYQYKFYPTAVGSIAAGSYRLQSDFEYHRVNWSRPLPGEIAFAFTCGGTPMRNTGICGDGVINGPEECEVGMTKYCSPSSSNIDMRGKGCVADADCGTTASPAPPAGTSWCVTKEAGCRILTCEREGGRWPGKFCSGKLTQSCTDDAGCTGFGTCVDVRKFCSGDLTRKCLADADCRGVGQCVEEIDLVAEVVGGTHRCPTCAIIPPEGQSCPTDKVIRMQQKASTPIRDGRQAFDCNAATCTWRKVGSCTALCGDGVVQSPAEQCDQGPLGGRIPGGGTSATNQYACTRADATTPGPCMRTGGYCNDGIIQTAYGERCDDGPVCSLATDCTALAGCSCSVTIAGQTFRCTVANGARSCGNGVYGIKPATTPARSWCKLDCTAFGPFCGDGIVNENEVCDKNSVTSKGVCVPSGTTLADTATALASYSPCEGDTDCSAGTCAGGDRAGQACRSNAECTGTGGGTCSNIQICATCGNSPAGYPQFRTRNCFNPGETGVTLTNQCTWRAWLACAPAGVCGNGDREGAEECDDGNTNNNDECIITASGGIVGPNNCKTARCGDGFQRTEVEDCDRGAANGAGERARCEGEVRYGETCIYCDTGCIRKTLTGPRCGDRIKNGPEVCDDRAGTGLFCQKIGVVNYFVTPAGNTGVKVPPRAGTPPTLDCPADCPTTVPVFTNSPQCPAQPPTGDPVFNRAICAANCLSTCPPTYDIRTLTFGVERRTSVELAAGEPQQIILPPCRILGDLKADIDMTGVTPPTLNVVFVTDRSGSMSWGSTDWSAPNLTCGGRSNQSRLDCTKHALLDAINQLSDYADVKIGLVSYGLGDTSGVNDGKAFIDQELISVTFRSTLEDKVRAYQITNVWQGTDLSDGLKKAKDVLTRTGVEGEKIIIVMSDGNINRPTSYSGCTSDIARCAASIEANNIKPSIKIYSLAFFGADSDERDLTMWSSQCSLISGRDRGSVSIGSLNPDGSYTGGDYNCPATPKYFYDVEDVRELIPAYRVIIESLTTARITVGAVETTGIRTGTLIPLEMGAIRCKSDTTSDTDRTYDFKINFSGTGKARISNLRAYTCPGPPWPPP